MECPRVDRLTQNAILMAVSRSAAATAADRDRAGAGVLTAIGNTPLVRLERLLPDTRLELYAKLEALNPGGSIKDRPAREILLEAMQSGEIGPGTRVIESSSGNMAVGLAQVCAYLGLRFVCVVDAKTTPQNVAILRAYGAEVDSVGAPDPATGEYLPARIRRVTELRARHPGSFWPNQYANRTNAAAHHATMREIASAMDGRLDYLFCATSTCGTLRGCAEYIRSRRLATQVVAVDAEGSVIFGARGHERLIPGHGAAVRPALYQAGLADHVVHVTDLDCVIGCRSLVRREAILAGGSSGAVVTAVHRMRHDMAPDARCAVILPDRGERYLETIYSDAWVEAHFGRVPALIGAEVAPPSLR
jgi:N-(2-amino-2-carboxyethyl)-L-glutamate synthase